MADDYQLDDEDDLESVLGAYGQPPYKGDIDTPESLRRADDYNARPTPYEAMGPNPQPREGQMPAAPAPYEQAGPQPAAPYEQQGPQPQTDVQRRLAAVREYYDRQNQGWSDWINRAQARPGGLPDSQARWFKKRMADANDEEAKVREAVQGGAPLPSHWGMTMGSDWLQRGQGQSPFNANAYVAGLTAPPPPPITVYRGGVAGGETPGSPPPELEAAAYYGHALKQVEQQVLAHQHMSPQSKDIVLRKIYEDAAEVAKNQTLGKGQGQQAPEQQQFSASQRQVLAQLDKGEDDITREHVAGGVDDEGYNSVMMQIADQRAAVRAKAIPQGPTSQEKFDQQRVTMPDGRVFTEKFHTNGTHAGWEPVEDKHKSTRELLITQNPYDTLADIDLHVASGEATHRGLPPHPNLPPLHGPKRQTEKEEKDPTDMQFRAQALKELQALQPKVKAGDEPPPPITMDQIGARAANLKQVHQKEKAAREGAGKHGAAPQGGAPPAGAATQTGPAPDPATSAADRYFDAYAAKTPAVEPLRPVLQKAYAGNDAEAIIATKTAIGALSRGPTNLSLAERFHYREALKVLKRQNDRIKVPSLSELNVPEDYEPPAPPQPPPANPRGEHMMTEAGPPV